MPKLLMLLVLATGCGVAHANEPADAGADAYIHLYGGDAGASMFYRSHGGIALETRQAAEDPYAQISIFDYGEGAVVFVDRRTKKVTITVTGAKQGYTCVVGH